MKPKSQPKPVSRTVNAAPAEKKAVPKKEEDDSLKPLSQAEREALSKNIKDLNDQ